MNTRSIIALALCLVAFQGGGNRRGGGGGAGPAWCSGFQFCQDFEIVDTDCQPDEIGPVGEAGRSVSASVDDAGEANCDSGTAAVEGTAGLTIDGNNSNFVSSAIVRVDNAVLDAATDHWVQFCHKQSTYASEPQTFGLVSFRSNGADQASDARGFLRINADATPDVFLRCDDGFGTTNSAGVEALSSANGWNAITVRFDEVDGANFKLDLWVDGDPSVDGAEETVTCLGVNPNVDGHTFVWSTFLSGANDAVIHFDKVRWKTGTAPGALTCP